MTCLNKAKKSFLEDINPAIFTAKARHGGVKIKLPEHEVICEKKIPKDLDLDQATKDYRIRKVLAQNRWVTDEDYETHETENVEFPLQENLEILSVVLSTIMMLAIDSKEATKSHLQWTIDYLSCVKDEFGRTPPNIQMMLNYIKNNNLIEDAPDLVQEVPEAEVEEEEAPAE